MEWLKTGIDGLDDYINGFPKGRCTSIMGAPGTGKTLMALSFAASCVENGMNVMYIATEDSTDDILSQSSNMGLDTLIKSNEKNFHIKPVLETRGAEMESLYISDFHKISRDFASLTRDIEDDINVVIIDNIGVFSIGMEPQQYRDQIDYLIFRLSKRAITTLIVSDEAVDEALMHITMHASFACMRLFRATDPYGGDMMRVMDIIKVRNSPTPVDFLKYEITNDGIKVLSEAKGIEN